MELFKGDKYDWSFKEGTYTLTVKNPTTVEEGTYQIVVKELDMKASGYLNVKGKHTHTSVESVLSASWMFESVMVGIIPW